MYNLFVFSEHYRQTDRPKDRQTDTNTSRITFLFIVYHVLVMTITVLNAIVTATISFKVKDLLICINGCKLHMDIMTGKKILSI